ncbi:MAG TPA: AraC family transcriptional regulator [Burkholderiaceae bacterium]|nr:AraC family transcriptional regulator [Burkholderiaceae bacterium]
MRQLHSKSYEGNWLVEPILSSHKAELATEAVTPVSNRTSAYSTAPHTHDCDMIFIPLAGRFVVEREASDALQTRPGYFVWIPAQYAHATHAYTTQQKHLALYVQTDFWAFVTGANGISNTEIGLRPASSSLTYYASRLAFNDNPAATHAISAHCGALVHEAARLSAAKPVPSCPLNSTEFVFLFADHIRNHLAEPLEIDAFALQQRLSRRQIERLFQQSFGMSPLLYQQQQRLERAVHLLKETDYSVLSIAQEVGWSSGSYLARMLTKAYGITPGGLRSGAQKKGLL